MKDASKNISVIIMAGGAGTRFWPLSTQKKPKQFLRLFDEQSLLQKSFDRASRLIESERILILTNDAYVGMVKEQLPGIPAQNIIGEPMKRDTAAAVCLAALIAQKRFGTPTIVTLTADHLIEPLDLFQKTILSAAGFAMQSQEGLYTFGIPPTYPATGYGYLEVGEKIADDERIAHFQLMNFKEKPDLETAKHYVKSGKFYWNSGMFVWTAESILQHIKEHLRDHFEHLSKAMEDYGTSRWPDALKKAFSSIPAISIDYGVMEKAHDVRCVIAPFSWTDVGGWLAIEKYLKRDDNGNHSRGEIHPLSSTDNLIYCEDEDEKVVIVGVDKITVVRSGKKTLIVHRDRMEEVKKVIQSLKEA